MLAQDRFAEIQGKDRLYFCGAWTRWGFHEDGIASAVRVAKLMGLEIPWKADADRPSERMAA
jgi:predicted NAD/FAD-binding protein